MTIEAHNLSVTIDGTLSDTLSRVPFLAIKEKVLGKDYDLSIAFVPAAVAKDINSNRRGKDYVPNTLSFSLDKKSGEILMCRSAIRAQYKEFDMSHETYVIFLLIHSMLHLKGYAHGSTMEHKEKALLAIFSPHHHGKTAHHRRH